MATVRPWEVEPIMELDTTQQIPVEHGDMSMAETPPPVSVRRLEANCSRVHAMCKRITDRNGSEWVLCLLCGMMRRWLSEADYRAKLAALNEVAP